MSGGEGKGAVVENNNNKEKITDTSAVVSDPRQEKKTLKNQQQKRSKAIEKVSGQPRAREFIEQTSDQRDIGQENKTENLILETEKSETTVAERSDSEDTGKESEEDIIEGSPVKVTQKRERKLGEKTITDGSISPVLGPKSETTRDSKPTSQKVTSRVSDAEPGLFGRKRSNKEDEAVSNKKREMLNTNTSGDSAPASNAAVSVFVTSRDAPTAKMSTDDDIPAFLPLAVKRRKVMTSKLSLKRRKLDRSTESSELQNKVSAAPFSVEVFFFFFCGWHKSF